MKMLKIFKLFSQNKKTLFLIMGVGVFLSLVPFFFANAIDQPPGEFCPNCGPNPLQWPNCIKCLLEYVFSLPFRIPFFVLVLIIGIVALVCGLFLGLATALLAWAVKIFVSVPITNAPVVIAGWTFSRDFANMFFILALVFIGLSTILRIREYEAKKALPILIIIAILINFTPVIVGFIVDMSNIITDFFLKNTGGIEQIGNHTSAAITYLKNSIVNTFLIDGNFFSHLLPYTDVKTGQPMGGILAEFTGTMIYGLVLIAYFLLAALIYLLIAMVFFIRIIILWILAILAPIAFLSKIFPATKETKLIFPSILHWDEWWEKLIQWSIVGIPIGFFLYLSNYVLTIDINTLFGAGGTVAGGTLACPTGPPFPPDYDKTLCAQLAGQGQAGLTGAFAAMILSILSPIVALVLLLWGANISLQAAPAGARGIVNFAKKGGKWISSRRPVRLAMGAAAGGAAGLIGGAARRARALEAAAGRLPGGKVWSKMVKPATWMTRGAEMGAVPALRKYESKARRVSYDEMFKGMEAGEMAQTIEALSTKRDRVEAAAWMAEKGLIDKPGLPKGFKDKAIAGAKDLLTDPHYQKSSSDVLESLTRGVDEKVMLDMETDQGKQKELKEKIGKTADEISKDEKIAAEIKTQLAEERKVSVDELGKEDMDQRMRDTAARKLWVGGLKSGDVKDIEKDSFRKDIGTRLGMQSWGSSHMSSLQQNFKKDVIDAALNNTGGLNAMFEGKSEGEGKEILEKLYRENPRIVNFMANTPAGREWGWKGMRHMDKSKKNGRPTYALFRERMDGEIEKMAAQPKAPTKEEMVNQTLKETPEIQKAEKEMSDLEIETETLASQRETAMGAGDPALASEINEKIEEKQAEIIAKRADLDKRKKDIEKDIEKIIAGDVEKLTKEGELLNKEIGTLKSNLENAIKSGDRNREAVIGGEIPIKEKGLSDITSQLATKQERLEVVIQAREKEEEKLIKKATDSFLEKPERKISKVERGFRKDYQKTERNVKIVDRDIKAVLAEIDKARKTKDNERLKDFQKKYEDKQKELESSRETLRRSAIEYGEYIKEIEEIEKEDRGL